MSSQPMYQPIGPSTPSRDQNKGYQEQSRNPSPITGDRSYNYGGTSSYNHVSPGNNVVVTKRLVEPDRSYLETLKKTIEENMREEQRLRDEKDQLIRDNHMLQQQLNMSQTGNNNDPSYESNLQRNIILKNEIADLQRRLERERENQRKSMGFQEQKLRDYQDRIKHIEIVNTQLKHSLVDTDEKENQLRMLTQENQRLKEELFSSGDGIRIDTVQIVQDNANLKAKVSELERELQKARTEKDRLEQESRTSNKSDKLMRELKRLNDDNVRLYDDNKLLMRHNNQLKNELEEARRGGMSVSNITLDQTTHKKMQDNMEVLYQENRNLSNELSAVKSRMMTDTKNPDLENQIGVLRAELAARDRDIQELRMRAPRSEGDYRNLENELRATNQTLQEQYDKIRILNMNMSQREEEVRRLNQQLSNSSINSQSQVLIKARDEEILILSRAKFELEKRLNDSEGNLKNLKTENDNVRYQLNTMVQGQNGSTMEITNMRNRVKDLEYEKEDMKRRMNTQPQQDEVLRQKEYLEKELERKVQREKRIETELTKLRNEVEMLIEERWTEEEIERDGGEPR